MRYGIFGGGQLAWMLGRSVLQNGDSLRLLGVKEDDPATLLTPDWVLSSELTPSMISECEALLFESEFLDFDVWEPLLRNSLGVYPRPELMSRLSNKLEQKKLFDEMGFAQPRYQVLAENKTLPTGNWVAKLTKQGYDGYGNFFLKESYDSEKWLSFLKKAEEKKIEIYLEEFCAFESECALVVARDFRGSFLSYPLFFTQQDNGICSWVWGPAQAFDPGLKNVEQEARELARTFLDKIDYVGVMAFEFFLTKEKKLLLNEVAPRVHNSGHLTLEAFDLDQFSLHCMAIRGFEKEQLQPLSKVYLMKNLLGTSEGSSSWKAQVLKRDTSTAYWYGKQTLRKGRKHGHLTCLFDNPEEIQKYKNQLNESAQNLWQEVQLSIKI